MMRLALFPDQQQVLLQRSDAVEGDRAASEPAPNAHERSAAAEAALSSSPRAPYQLPEVAALRRIGYEPPLGVRTYGTFDGQEISGELVSAQRLEKLLLGKAAQTLGLQLMGRRVASDLMDIDEYWQMNRAFHLADWNTATRFCGVCASPTDYSEVDLAKVCPSCGRMTYPQIAPAVIMAVVRDGTILLAHNRRHPGRMFSVLAGFVEPGETLERAVAREVREESGVAVRDIEYFSSQPWPFPNSIMLAFTCRWASGEAIAVEDEIDEVGWYSPSELPEELPGRFSVARRLIEWFVSEHGTGDDLQALLARDAG